MAVTDHLRLPGHPGDHQDATGCGYLALRADTDNGQVWLCTKCGWSKAAAVLSATHLAEQSAWSQATFGPGTRLQGVLAHLRSELDEVEADPADVSEWVDVIILALDGALRQGHAPQAIIDAYHAKQAKNRARRWPDWRQFSEDQPIEHDRSGEP